MDENIVSAEHVDTPNGTYRVRVTVDLDQGESPREWDNTGIMVCKHRRYNLPFESGLAHQVHDALSNYNFGTVARRLHVRHGATVVLPVWGYDHGELRLTAGGRTYPFDCAWDSGFVGVIFDTPETREKTGVVPEHIADTLAAEVDIYDQWLNCEIYQWTTEKRIDPTDPDDDIEWEFVDSCGGCYGAAYAMNAGKEAIPDGELIKT